MTAVPVAASTGFSPSPRHGHIGGFVPVPSGRAQQTVQGRGDLTWYGGPVMHTNTTYAIYWAPSGHSFPSGYETTIDRYFADVAADSGTNTNVYGILNQYSDGNGNLTYNSTFAGSVADTDAYPANGCVSALTVCLSSYQLESEVASVIARQGWPENGTTEYFLFTPPGVISCAPFIGCAYSGYCAYHGGLVSSGGEIIYANQPWAKGSICDLGRYPNGSASGADPQINLVSHEHSEAITDPWVPAAWKDSAGYEVGDKCAWIFGPTSGPRGAEYTQTINGHHYWMQEEYSNATHDCVQGHAPPAETLTVSKPGRGSGSVTSSPAGISCGATCSHQFAYGSSVTLTATPASGSTFTGWSGACSGTGSCVVTTTSAASVTAAFSLNPKPKACVVPKLKGKTLGAARSALAVHHCSLGKITRSVSKQVKKGRVISQKPRPGKRLKHGAKVNLVISKGKH